MLLKSSVQEQAGARNTYNNVEGIQLKPDYPGQDRGNAAEAQEHATEYPFPHCFGPHDVTVVMICSHTRRPRKNAL